MEYISSKKFLHGHFLEEHGPGPSFRILNSIPNGLITLNGRISEILFSTPLKVLQEKKEIILSREIFPIPEFLNIVQFGLVYIDIIEEQYFGDILAKIIKCFPIKQIEFNQVVTLFENLQYVNVDKTRITSIQIQLRDLEGNPIQFENNFFTVIATLHFKPLV